MPRLRGSAVPGRNNSSRFRRFTFLDQLPRTFFRFLDWINAASRQSHSRRGEESWQRDGPLTSLQFDKLVVVKTAVLGGTFDVPVNPYGGFDSEPSLRGTVGEFSILDAKNALPKFYPLLVGASALALFSSDFGTDRLHAGDGLGELG